MPPELIPLSRVSYRGLLAILAGDLPGRRDRRPGQATDAAQCMIDYK